MCIKCALCKRLYYVQASDRANVKFRCAHCGTILIHKPTTSSSNKTVWIAVTSAAVGCVISALITLVVVSNMKSGAEPEPTRQNEAGTGSKEVAFAKKSSEPARSVQGEHLKWKEKCYDVQKWIREEFAKTNDYEGVEFEFIDKEPFLFAMQGPVSEKMRERAWENLRILCALVTTFRDEFRTLEFGDIEEVLPVVLFSSKQDFVRHTFHRYKNNFSTRVNAYYEYSKKRTISYYSDIDFEAIRERLIHEAVHQIMHNYSTKKKGNDEFQQLFWLQEGLACYFENAKINDASGGEKTLAVRRNFPRLMYARECIAEKPVALSTMIEYTQDRFWDWFKDSMQQSDDPDRRAQQYYGYAWALVYYLKKTYPTEFDECFRRIMSGGGSRAAFDQAFKQTLSLEILDKELADFINRN